MAQNLREVSKQEYDDEYKEWQIQFEENIADLVSKEITNSKYRWWAHRGELFIQFPPLDKEAKTDNTLLAGVGAEFIREVDKIMKIKYFMVEHQQDFSILRLLFE